MLPARARGRAGGPTCCSVGVAGAAAASRRTERPRGGAEPAGGRGRAPRTPAPGTPAPLRPQGAFALRQGAGKTRLENQLRVIMKPGKL